MLNKILVPLDGSLLAQCSLPHTLALARVFNSEVTMLHVLEQQGVDEQAQIDPLDWHMRKAEAQNYLRHISAQWAEAAPAAETVLLEGSAAERIVEYADEQNTDLIVLSSHGRSGLSEWNISSVVQKIIMRAYRSVFIVRAYKVNNTEAVEPADYKRILVPVDGSKRAEIVLPMVRKLAETYEAEIVLAHVVARPTLLRRQQTTAEDEALVEELVERNQAEARKYLEQLQSRLSPQVGTRVLVGESAAVALHHLVETENIDLVVLSAHGQTGDHRLYGGVVTHFINYGATPLLIIQDLPQDKIQPTEAEKAVQSHRGTNHLRTLAYAQPAHWYYR